MVAWTELLCKSWFSDNYLQNSLDPSIFRLFWSLSPLSPLVNVEILLKKFASVSAIFLCKFRVCQHWHGGRGAKKLLFLEGSNSFVSSCLRLQLEVGVCQNALYWIDFSKNLAMASISQEVLETNVFWLKNHSSVTKWRPIFSLKNSIF